VGLDLALGVLVDAAGDDRYAARFYAQGSASANGLGLLADGGGADRLRVEDRYAWGAGEPLRYLPSVGLLLFNAREAFQQRVEVPPPPAREEASAACASPDLAVRRDDLEALIAAGEALRCRLAKGELWEEARALLARDAAHPLAAWIARALEAAPEGMRPELRAALAAHPSCSVRAIALSEEGAQAALRSSCWMLQAAALRLRGGKAAPGVSLPSFLRAPRAY
jgi:hypothetical protein